MYVVALRDVIHQKQSNEEDKEMSKLDTVQKELCRKLGDEYRIQYNV